MLRQDDVQKTCLVFAGYRHGLPYGGHLSACLIMSVLSNRVRRGWGTWMEVIDRIPNFAAIKEMPTGSPQIWDASFVRLLHEVDPIFDGSKNYAQFKDSDGKPVDALYWCDTRYIETPFFKEKILGQLSTHPRIGEMGTLAFFA